MASVDYGTDRRVDLFSGVQCKGKDGDYAVALTVAELVGEVEKAKSFAPALQAFVLVTSAPDDVAVQAEARRLTADHAAKGLFTVSVMGWGTLKQHLTDYPDLVEKHFPDLAPISIDAGLERVEADRFAGRQSAEDFSPGIGAQH